MQNELAPEKLMNSTMQTQFVQQNTYIFRRMKEISDNTSREGVRRPTTAIVTQLMDKRICAYMTCVG